MIFSITPRPIDPTLLLLICFICFIVCVCVAIYESIKQTRLTFFGVKTDATCVCIEWKGEGRSKVRSYTFRFKNKADAVVEVKDILCTEGTNVGDVIPIVYLPAHPEVVSLSGIKGWGFLLFITTIGFLIGVLIRHCWRQCV